MNSPKQTSNESTTSGSTSTSNLVLNALNGGSYNHISYSQENQAKKEVMLDKLMKEKAALANAKKEAEMAKLQELKAKAEAMKALLLAKEKLQSASQAENKPEVEERED